MQKVPAKDQRRRRHHHWLENGNGKVRVAVEKVFYADIFVPMLTSFHQYFIIISSFGFWRYIHVTIYFAFDRYSFPYSYHPPLHCTNETDQLLQCESSHLNSTHSLSTYKYPQLDRELQSLAPPNRLHIFIQSVGEWVYVPCVCQQK